MNLKRIAELLDALSIAAASPVFSGAGVAISATLKLAGAIVARGQEGAEELEKLTSEVQEMVRDGRQPTAEEWKNLRRRSDTAHSILQGNGPLDPALPAGTPESRKARFGNETGRVPEGPEKVEQPPAATPEERKDRFGNESGRVPDTPAGTGHPVKAVEMSDKKSDARVGVTTTGEGGPSTVVEANDKVEAKTVHKDSGTG